MTDNQAAESGAVEDKAAREAAVLSQDNRDYEAEARKMGWVPEEEFKGDRKPAKFKSAQEFVEDGENLSPHVKRLLAAQEKTFDDRLARIEKVNAKTAAEVEKNHQAEIIKLKAERKQAVKDGDAEEVERLSEEIETRQTKADEGVDDDADGKAEEDFVSRNSWYGEDPILTNAAESISRRIAKIYFDKHGKQMPYAENLKQVEAKIKSTPEYKSRFPDGKPAANGHAAVDGGGEGTAPSRNDPFAKLSSAERAKAADDMKKYPKIYPTKQAWVEAYNS